MTNSNIIKPLAKVIAALAWADGTIANQEVNQVKSLLISLSGMTASDWAEIDIYLDAPVGDAERKRLVFELQNALHSNEDKAYALSVIDQLVKADGVEPQQEKEAYDEVRSAIESASTGVLSRLVGGNRQVKPGQTAPNRELYIDDFMRNKIFYDVSRRLEMQTAEIDISEDQLRKLSLAGGLMALVAYVDRDVDQGEIGTMVNAMQDHWDVNEIEANLVAEVAVSESTRGLDGYLLASQLFDVTTQDERMNFLDVLFAVADGDGGVSYLETEEIRIIATILKLTHQQFIDAKLKIPLDRRPSEKVSSMK